MIDFIAEVGNFVGRLLGMILEIPITRHFGNITGFNLGTLLIIIGFICMGILFLKGGKGD